jgi:hypothetical protein
MNVRRGPVDCAARILEQVAKTPDGAPTKAMAYAGVAYPWLRRLQDSGLVEVTGKGF